MSVRGVGGGGKGGRAGGAKGPSGGGGVGKSSGSFGPRVDRSESLVGASREASSGNVGPIEPAITARAMDIARQLKAGQLQSREEATKKFVSEVLKEKLRMQSKALTSKIADALQDDPRLNQALERLWSKAE